MRRLLIVGVVVGLVGCASSKADVNTAPTPTTKPSAVTTPVSSTKPAASTVPAEVTTTTAAVTTTTEPASTTTTEPPTTVPPTTAAPATPGVRTGDDGTMFRLDAVRSGVTPTSPLVSIAAGFSLTEIDVEICAGPDGWSVNPLYLHLKTDVNHILDPEFAGGTLPAYHLPAGGCIRGTVPFSVPDGEKIATVQFNDVFDTIAEFPPTETAEAAGTATTPLQGAATPKAVAVGDTIDGGANGKLTLHGVDPHAKPGKFSTVPKGATLTTIDVELCATTDELSVNPLYWYAQLADNTIIDASLTGADPQLSTSHVAPGSCSRGLVSYVVPAGQTISYVTYEFALGDETGRWTIPPAS